MGSHTGPGFHNLGLSNLTHLSKEAVLVPIHSFAYSFTQQRASPQRKAKLERSEQLLHVPLVKKNQVPLWRDGNPWGYHCPTIYVRCGAKKLVNRDFSASALLTKVDY